MLPRLLLAVDVAADAVVVAVVDVVAVAFVVVVGVVVVDVASVVEAAVVAICIPCSERHQSAMRLLA